MLMKEYHILASFFMTVFLYSLCKLLFILKHMSIVNLRGISHLRYIFSSYYIRISKTYKVHKKSKYFIGAVAIALTYYSKVFSNLFLLFLSAIETGIFTGVIAIFISTSNIANSKTVLKA